MSRKDVTLARLREALQRVLAGTATRVRPGHRLSVSAVCAEAGLSRTAVYKRYPEIIHEIEGKASEDTQRRVPRARRRELEVRAENESLRTQLKASLSENATLLFRLSQATKTLATGGEVIPIRSRPG